jgi:hypothetical protein
MKTGMMTADGKMVPSRTWWYLREVSNVDPTRILNVTGKGDLKTLTWDEIELLWKTLTGTDL